MDRGKRRGKREKKSPVAQAAGLGKEGRRLGESGPALGDRSAGGADHVAGACRGRNTVGACAVGCVRSVERNGLERALRPGLTRTRGIVGIKGTDDGRPLILGMRIERDVSAKERDESARI